MICDPFCVLASHACLYANAVPVFVDIKRVAPDFGARQGDGEVPAEPPVERLDRRKVPAPNEIAVPRQRGFLLRTRIIVLAAFAIIAIANGC